MNRTQRKARRRAGRVRRVQAFVDRLQCKDTSNTTYQHVEYGLSYELTLTSLLQGVSVYYDDAADWLDVAESAHEKP